MRKNYLTSNLTGESHTEQQRCRFAGIVIGTLRLINKIKSIRFL